jgi:ornithine cyclodeaminase/alanine dehydrogenase-like protein (mu-crystallin family)
MTAVYSTASSGSYDPGRHGAIYLTSSARIFVDDIRQCRTDGEINVPLSEGLITEADIAGEIGEVVTGKKHGRTAQGRHVAYAGQFVSVFVSPAGAVDCIEDDGLLGT